MAYLEDAQRAEIDARSVTVRLGGVEALNGAGFAAASGEMVGLIGPNGAGKTTLLRVLAGLQETDSGEVLFGGRTLAEVGVRNLAREMSYLPQGAPCHWELPVEQVVALGRLPYIRSFQQASVRDWTVIDSVLARTEITAFRNRPVQSLSSGERARVMVARALAQEPKVLLADEPTVALDPYHQLKVLEIIRDTAHGGASVVAVLHDLSLAGRYCDRLVLIVGGRVIAEGRPEAVLTDANLRAAYGVEVIHGATAGPTLALPAA